MRGWIAVRLNVQAKDVTLVGSARIGFSMHPNNFGREFGGESDLDLTVINEPLFERCRANAFAFVQAVSDGDPAPRNEAERKYWPENARWLPANIQKGFLNTFQIPNLSMFEASSSVNHVMSIVKRRLEVTEGAPRPKKVSARVYRNWDSLVAQVAFNLETARRKLDGDS
ncbi:hypothetical protein [Pandoraea eparura]|uniref:hypothetical protein n=1 Tax=Pandoraea eparura TaxID=2508291 RepID=UPI0015833932|nr:hypothetical protein [Pandoraea eparura]